MHLIVYISKFVQGSDTAETVLTNIIAHAKTNNQKSEITGVLFYENGHFLQAIEGDEKSLRLAYGKISSDKRHDQIIKIIDEPIKIRSFPDWSLDTFYIDKPTLIDANTIVSLQKLYENNFEMNSKNLIDFIKKMVDELDTFNILQEDDTPKEAP